MSFPPVTVQYYQGDTPANSREAQAGIFRRPSRCEPTLGIHRMAVFLHKTYIKEAPIMYQGFYTTANLDRLPRPGRNLQANGDIWD